MREAIAAVSGENDEISRMLVEKMQKPANWFCGARPTFATFIPNLLPTAGGGSFAFNRCHCSRAWRTWGKPSSSYSDSAIWTR